MEKYLDESLSFEERARDLVSRMTLEEKISQTIYSSPAIPRLDIPAYNWWNEALHGVARAGVATMFPQAIGMAATFDTGLIGRVAECIAHEGRAKYNSASKRGDRDIYKGLTFWSPNINIFRDPRWGRGHETYGEDPYLTGRMGVAFIKGLQGNHPRYLKAAACAKHYCVHSGPEGMRHEFDAVVSKRDLKETYLPAFKEAVEEGKVEAVMGAYNRTNGEPCCGSKTLLQDILREEWGFMGHVVSDCWAVRDFHEHHKITRTAPESAAMAINNGCDLNCGSAYNFLNVAYNEGLVTEETIDRAVTRLMTTRMKLGMFDKKESVPFNAIGYTESDTPEHNALALEVARRSMVLLKNKDNLLPLNRDKLRSIAVIGPNADSREALEGNYFGTASEYVTVLEGIREAKNPGTRLYYAQGCHLFKERASSLSQPGDRMAEALEAASVADVTVLCLGLDATIEGEQGDTGNAFASGDKLSLELPGEQQKLLEKICEMGKPVVVIILAGSALDLRYADEHANAVVQAWYPGGQGGRAVAALLFGDYSPSGRLPVTVYRSTDDLPDFEDYSMENRTYKFFKGEPLYPFGYGLGYTGFEYSDLAVKNEVGFGTRSLNVEVSVTNTGGMKAYETVQLYVKDMESKYRLPLRQLKGVKAVELRPGESKRVSFSLTESDLSVFDDDGVKVFEPGVFTVYAGGSQPDGRSVSLTGKAPLSAVVMIE